jgi:hypothetical protein
MPDAAKKITNHLRNGLPAEGVPVQPCGHTGTFDGKAEVGQRNVRLQQCHGAGLRVEAEARRT